MLLMRYYKHKLEIDKLMPPHQKGVLAFFKRNFDKKRMIPNRSLSIFINRYCNLSCFSCCALGMDPTPDETSLEEIKIFLDKFRDYRPGSSVLLTGGEPTMVNTKKLKRICDLIHESGKKVGLLTNGYRLHPIEWFDYVVLDLHGVNDKEIEVWRRVLIESGRWFEEVDKRYHQDMEYAMKDNITCGLRCTSFMKPLTLWKDVIYPCCNIMCVEWWNHSARVTQALKRSKWTIYNPWILRTVKDWRETLPNEFIRMCSLRCWRNADKVIWRKIT